MHQSTYWILIMLLISITCCTEDSDVQVISLDMEGYAGAVVLPLENGYAIAGFSQKANNNHDFMLACLDLNHTLIWLKTFESSTLDSVSDFIQTDEGFVMVGTSRSPEMPEVKVKVVKTTKTGELVWCRTYPLYSSYTTGESIFEVEGGYLVGGTNIEEYKRAYVMKLDSQGNKLWMKTYENGTDLYDMEKTKNGFILVGSIDFTDYSDAVVQGNSTQYVLVQSCSSADSSNKDVWVQEIDQNGHVLWTQHYDTNRDDSGKSILMLDDGFLIAGNTSEGKNYDFWIVKTDQEGNLSWSRTFNHDNDLVYDLAGMEGKYIIGGNTNTINYDATDFDSVFGESNIFIVCIDENGNEKWRKIVGDSDKNEILRSIDILDSKIIIVGILEENDVDRIIIGVCTI